MNRNWVSIQFGETARSHLVGFDPRHFRWLWLVLAAILAGAGWLVIEIVQSVRIYPELLLQSRRAAGLRQDLAELADRQGVLDARMGAMDSVAARLLARYGLRGSPVSVVAERNQAGLLDLLFPESSPEAMRAERAQALARLGERREREVQAAAAIARERIAKWEHTPSVAPARGQLTSGFGMRFHPILGRYQMHEGQDISGPVGVPVAATAAGIVTKAEYNSSFGNYVVVAHGGGVSTLYAHLSALRCRVGDRVHRGQRIGLLGSTGRSTGPHVHYEVHIGASPVNPLRWILPVTLAP